MTFEFDNEYISSLAQRLYPGVEQRQAYRAFGKGVWLVYTCVQDSDTYPLVTRHLRADDLSYITHGTLAMLGVTTMDTTMTITKNVDETHGVILFLNQVIRCGAYQTALVGILQGVEFCA